MNNGEAGAINTVLRHMLRLPAGDGRVPTDDRARDAAEFLADRANRALHAGLRGTDVRQHWPADTDGQPTSPETGDPTK